MPSSLFRLMAALTLVGTASMPAWAGTVRGAASPNGAPRVDAAEVVAPNAVRLDGAFNESAWEQAEPITGFVQREPNEGAPATFATEARVLYDKTFLYIAVRAFDPEPSRIVGIRTRRDGGSPSDWISVFVDSYHDRRTAYQFAVNAAGVKQDAYWFADQNQDDSWDAVWDVEVTKDDKGWMAEFRIPFSQLRYEPGKRETFGFAVWRDVPRINEKSTWPLLSKSATGFVSSFGELGGLRLTGSAKRLELVPYAVGQVNTQPVESGNPFVRSPGGMAAAGADLKYALTPGLTLTGTINPDFGQVEADPAVVNLSAFETFYQERRPFFVEGSGNLRFNLDCNDGSCTGLFYSRRIGRRPQGYPDTPDGGFVSVPSQTTIIGAAKLTGRAGAFSVGALNAVTAEEIADVSDGLARSTQTVEPLTNFTVLQAKREWANQSSLGFMITNTARAINDDVSFLARNAVTGGANWDWRLKDPRYAITGYWAGSSISGSAEAIDRLQTGSVHLFQRPDTDHVGYDATRTSLNGHAGSLSLQKIGGQTVRFSVYGGYKSPGFDINDLGFLRRADQMMQSNWIQFRQDRPFGIFRTVRFNVNQWAAWNFAGDNLFYGGNINAHATFTSNWTFSIGLNAEGPGLDDRATRGGPAAKYPATKGVWYGIGTDSRKAVSGRFQSMYFRDTAGGLAFRLDPSITLRPTSFLSVAAGIGYERRTERSQWVEAVEDPVTHYVFGHLQQKTLGLTFRVNYTITPNLTVQVYAEPFVSAGAYDDFRELANGRADRYADRYRPYAYSGNPDFNYKSFRTTNVLRWEYKPGSALYVVWQQGREDVLDDGRFRFRQDFRDVFGLPASNVFLVKCSYWFNF
ncbi:MAG: DUF5916 domain-containing protein [Acidobacteriota bacterium]